MQEANQMVIVQFRSSSRNALPGDLTEIQNSGADFLFSWKSSWLRAAMAASSWASAAERPVDAPAPDTSCSWRREDLTQAARARYPLSQTRRAAMVRKEANEIINFKTNNLFSFGNLRKYPQMLANSSANIH